MILFKENMRNLCIGVLIVCRILEMGLGHFTDSDLTDR
jgi:hypothetical protein